MFIFRYLLEHKIGVGIGFCLWVLPYILSVLPESLRGSVEDSFVGVIIGVPLFLFTVLWASFFVSIGLMEASGITIHSPGPWVGVLYTVSGAFVYLFLLIFVGAFIEDFFRGFKKKNNKHRKAIP